MKTFFLALVFLFIVSCNDEPLNPFFDTASNPFSDHWEIHTSGELPGAATIYINSAGEIKNGIPMLYYDLAKVNTYIDGIVNKNGSIRANFYSNYVLESETRKKEFSLRSAHGGTMEPFFLHLFKGCLLFETLLKLSHQWPGGGLVTFYSDKKIRSALGVVNERSSEVKNKSIDDVVKVYNLWRSNSIPVNERVLWIAYGIRNATGHNLSSSAHDMTVDDFRNLSDDILFAIFLTISKLFTT